MGARGLGTRAQVRLARNEAKFVAENNIYTLLKMPSTHNYML